MDGATRRLRTADLRSALVAAAAGLAALATAVAAADSECLARPDGGLGKQPWLVPFEFELEPDPAAQQREYYDFMWRTFIALNWPAVGEPRGKPDCGADIFADHPGTDRVWETYPGPLQVFLPATRDPYPAWNDLPPQGAKGVGLQKIPTDFGIVINQPGLGNLSLAAADDFPTGALVDRNGHYVVYQVGINQAYYEYVRRFRYFDPHAQIAAVDTFLEYAHLPGAFQPPPSGNEAYLRDLPSYARQGMVEIKAAWRQLAEGDPADRYIVREVEVELIDVDPGQAVEIGRLRMGLVALHILRYTPNGRVAATFEQVDNVEVGHTPPSGLRPSFNSGAAPNAIQREIGFDNTAAGARASKIPPPISCDNPLRCDAFPDALPPCCDAAGGPASCVEPPTPCCEPGPATPVDVYRVTPIPKEVRRINAEYQAKLYEDESQSYSPLAYYQLVDTQNRHPGGDFSNPETNGHEGPITGVYTNANNLINTALESYTQKNFSCIGCHVAARPLGVTQASFGIDHFKILSFLLRRACVPKGRPCSTDAPCCLGFACSEDRVCVAADLRCPAGGG